MDKEKNGGCEKGKSLKSIVDFSEY